VTRSLRLALVDRAPLSPEVSSHQPAVPDPRCSTLSPASARLLHRAGAWEAVEGSGRCSGFHRMQVWDGSAAGCVSYDAQEAGRPLLGHVVENSVLVAALHARLRKDAAKSSGEGALELHFQDAVQQLSLPPAHAPPEADSADAGPDWAAARLERGGWLRARLVVAADGGQSPTRRLAGLRTVGWRYLQTAVVGIVTTAPQDHGTAWQRFLPHGPLALLPMHGGHSSVVWTTHAEHASSLVALSDAAFAAEVQAALHGTGAYATSQQELPQPLQAALSAWHSVTGIPPAPGLPQAPPECGPAPGAARASYPLALRHAGTYGLPRLALVGDAAHAVHPLAGQGLNLGLSDAQLLAGAVEEAQCSGGDVGDEQVVSSYAARAAQANAPMVAALDALQRLFGSTSPSVAALRSAGLNVVNASPALRRAIVQYATGEQIADGIGLDPRHTVTL
jgi:ubiquinone biosynthesis monooxygenase Coq6